MTTDQCFVDLLAGFEWKSQQRRRGCIVFDPTRRLDQENSCMRATHFFRVAASVAVVIALRFALDIIDDL